MSRQRMGMRRRPRGSAEHDELATGDLIDRRHAFDSGIDGRAPQDLAGIDVDTGRVLWTATVDAGVEGIPAVYEVRGREYIALAAGTSMGTGADPVWRNPFHRKPSKPEAQGYYVFALPSSSVSSTPSTTSK